MGRIEAIVGEMFSGKTEETQKRLRRAVIAKQPVLAFKHSADDRYSDEDIASHNGSTFKGIPIQDPQGIITKVIEQNNIAVVAIDEAQFFGDDLIDVIKDLAYMYDKRVLVTGLDMDFRAQPFGPMPKIMAIAEEVTKLHAICTECGDEASRTQRLVNGKPARFDDPVIMVGAAESYEARCREHHSVGIDSKEGAHGVIYVNPDTLVFKAA